MPSKWEKLQPKYKKEVPLDKRCAQSKGVRERHPDRIPVIIESVEGAGEAKNFPLKKNKFLATPNLTVGELGVLLRRRIREHAEGPLPADLETRSLFFYLPDGLTPLPSQTTAELYAKYRDPEDDFLYVKFAELNVFGASTQ
jgi:hypothetical protein